MLRQSLAGRPSLALFNMPSDPMYFDDTQKQMTTFLSQFENWANKKKEENQQQTRKYELEFNKLEARVNQLSSDIHLAEEEHKQTTMKLLSNEQSMEEWKMLITELETLEEQQMAQEEALKQQLESLEKQIAEKDAQLKMKLKQENEQELRIAPLISVYERVLGFSISGEDNDTTRVEFTLVDEKQPNKKFGFKLNVGKKTYTMAECKPVVAYEQLLEQLNEDRDLYKFMKLMRKQFNNKP